MAFRVLFAIAEYYNLDIDQMDVKTLFLYGFIHQLICVGISKRIGIEANRKMVWKLLKALYNVNQYLYLWYKKLPIFLLKQLSLRGTYADYSIFTTKTDINMAIVSMFVDDIKIMGTNRSGFIKSLKVELVVVVAMVDIGPIGLYFGFKVQRDRKKKTIKLSQPFTFIKSLRNSTSTKLTLSTHWWKKQNLWSKKPTAKLLFPKKKRPKNDWIVDLLDGGDQARYRFGKFSSKPICKEPISPAHQSSQNYPILYQGL